MGRSATCSDARCSSSSRSWSSCWARLQSSERRWSVWACPCCRPWARHEARLVLLSRVSLARARHPAAATRTVRRRVRPAARRRESRLAPPGRGSVSRIEDYALLGDLHSAALVGRDGSIDWMCLPSFDSPACFAALLDTPDAGRWLLAPAAGGTCTSRQYRGDTLVLETDWSVGEGRIRVVDFMKPRDRHPRLVRIVEGLAGAVEVRSEVRLRFDYGHIVPWVRHRGTRVAAIAGPDAVWLHSDVTQRGQDWSTVSEFTVRARDRLRFVLSWAAGHERAPAVLDAEVALLDTVAFWEAWVARGHL